ncbi:ABC transporter ATP-binding protein/permease [Enterococcus sp. BWR-S5]|uniref:ABC transporter ATP-binding protein/permease n=1 Tax=Enterococcus sp. BWR-S5 TaxID=2787714 RepID=UPI00192353BD|nr:ABC transporter ATP-binding protein/permease [Enterococcus sp. BWR-S5]MBL1225064.1 ABC transporter ATP-binding protein/permease [Enterococcus sp. BWR-S5]
MIDKRLFQLVEKKQLIWLVLVRLLNLGLSISMWLVFAQALAEYIEYGLIDSTKLLVSAAGVLIGKSILTKIVEKLTYDSSAALRLAIRKSVMQKAFRMGNNEGQLPSATLAQLSVEGIEQLEIYYARFLPQFFYCMLASLMIFFTLGIFAWQPAVILLICMPLIPIVIMAVMKIAKRILSNYWGKYTDLGKKFHENLNGLSVLKAYNQDEFKQKEVADDAERFRKVTMSLLSMQLNSITIMDIISYSGAALGIGFALLAYQDGTISTVGLLLFILLSAEFFIPMRQLGSLFHVAMNGISACGKLFAYLELPEQKYGNRELPSILQTITVEEVNFQYNKSDCPALQQISATFKQGSFSALVGKSGSGKSTFVRLLLHQLSEYNGKILWNDLELSELTAETIHKQALLVDNHGYLYPESIKKNLLLAGASISEKELWAVLDKVRLKEFVEQLPMQLEEPLTENGGNLSGGQRQRLLLARALLRQAHVYIFDEITSGIDLESEEIILEVLRNLSQQAIVLFISHRLYNVLQADQVLVFEDGKIVESGAPDQLQKQNGYFKDYFQEENVRLKGASK